MTEVLPQPPPRSRPPRRRRGRNVLLALAMIALAAVGLAALLSRGGRDEPRPPAEPGGAVGAIRRDPLAFRAGDEAELSARAAAGESHVIYAKSPGGVLATAQRTTRYRPLIDRSAAAAGVAPDLVEALVFLESGARADAIAGGDPTGAGGLTQIVAATGTGLLGLRIDLAESRRLTRRIARERRRGRSGRVARLEHRRRAVDPRFDPAEALAATARYLKTARARFGREDLAVTSYHMGIGNLEGVLRAYAGASSGGAIRDVVARDDLSYPRVFFDSSPVRHASAYDRLSGLGDDSSLYWWKILGAREIMRLWRTDRGRLRELAALQGAKASAEEVLHPRATADTYETPGDVSGANARGELVAIPNRPSRYGFRRDPRMGELAAALKQPRALYRGLRPEALALLAYLSAKVRVIGGPARPLVVTSGVRDERYQQLLLARNREATRGFSLHTTGYAFDVLRSYGTRAQARAFQFMLDRLETLNLIAWVREPGAIHVTVSRDAGRLLERARPPG